eukprot:194025-Pleurochrysis_carterae.AAC.1
MIGDFSAFGGAPTNVVISHSLLSGSRVRRCVRNGEGATSGAAPSGLQSGSLGDEKDGLPSTERVLAQTALERRSFRGSIVEVGCASGMLVDGTVDGVSVDAAETVSGTAVAVMGASRGAIELASAVFVGIGATLAAEAKTRASRKFRSGGYAAA